MPKFPEPPTVAELAAVDPDLAVLGAGTLLWRISFRSGRHPVRWHDLRTFGPLTGRFDHHLPDSSGAPRLQRRGILYAAGQGRTALAEVFQETRTIDRRDRDPWLTGFETTRELVLLDLTRSWPTRAGASMALSTGPRPRARRWSRAAYEAYPQIDGLHYPSSMDGNRVAVALYERGADALPERPLLHRPLSDPALLHPLKNAATDLGHLLV